MLNTKLNVIFSLISFQTSRASDEEAGLQLLPVQLQLPAPLAHLGHVAARGGRRGKNNNNNYNIGLNFILVI